MNMKRFMWVILVFCWSTYTLAYNLVIDNRTREDYQISIFIHPENFDGLYGHFDTETIGPGMRSIGIENKYLHIPDIPAGISDPTVKIQVVISHPQTPLKTNVIEHIPCTPKSFPSPYGGSSRTIMLAVPPDIKVILSDEAIIIEIEGKHYFHSRLDPHHIPLNKFIEENFDYDALNLEKMASTLYRNNNQELAAAYELTALAKKEPHLQHWFFKRYPIKDIKQFQKDYSRAEDFLSELINFNLNTRG